MIRWLVSGLQSGHGVGRSLASFAIDAFGVPDHADVHGAFDIDLHEIGNLLTRMFSIPAPVRRGIEDDWNSVPREKRANIDHLPVKGFPFFLVVLRPRR